MTSADGQALAGALQQSLAYLRSKLDGVSDGEASKRPAPDRWSILENLEHIIAVQTIFRSRIESAERGSERVENPEKEAQLLAHVPLRAERFQAPEPVHPKGRFQTVDEAMQAVQETLEQDLAFLGRRHQDLRYLTVPHPVAGTLSGYEGMLILAGHIRRHANQIEEIRQELAAR